MTEPASIEFSRPFDLSRLGADGAVVDIVADEAERAALAHRFGLQAVERLTASVRLKRFGLAGEVRVDGHFVADVTQTCVVTLEPVPALLDRRFTLVLTPDADAGEIDEGEDVDVEPLADEVVDVGDLVAEHLGLNLAPYPRRDGVVFSYSGADDGGDERRESPFAVLRHPKPET